MAAGDAGRLSKGELTLIVVVTALVLVFVVMLTQRLTQPASESHAASPTQAAEQEPTAAVEDPTDSGTSDGEDLSGLTYNFVTPSGNIACSLGSDRTVCAIGRYDYEVPEQVAAACEDGNVGHFIAVSARETALLCDTSGRQPTIDTDGVPVLGYGESTEANGFTCLSEETGVTCTHDDSGRTISVRRAEYTL